MRLLKAGFGADLMLDSGCHKLMVHLRLHKCYYYLCSYRAKILQQIADNLRKQIPTLAKYVQESTVYCGVNTSINLT